MYFIFLMQSEGQNVKSLVWCDFLLFRFYYISLYIQVTQTEYHKEKSSRLINVMLCFNCKIQLPVLVALCAALDSFQTDGDQKWTIWSVFNVKDELLSNSQTYLWNKLKNNSLYC